MKNLTDFISEQLVMEISANTLMRAHNAQVARNGGKESSRSRRFAKYAREKVTAGDTLARNAEMPSYKPKYGFIGLGQTRTAIDDADIFNDLQLPPGSKKISVPRGPVTVIPASFVTDNALHGNILIDSKYFISTVIYLIGRRCSNSSGVVNINKFKRAVKAYFKGDLHILFDSYDNYLDAIANLYKRSEEEELNLNDFVGKSADEIRDMLPDDFAKSFYKDDVTGDDYLDEVASILATGDYMPETKTSDLTTSFYQSELHDWYFEMINNNQ